MKSFIRDGDIKRGMLDSHTEGHTLRELSRLYSTEYMGMCDSPEHCADLVIYWAMFNPCTYWSRIQFFFCFQLFFKVVPGKKKC